jgi:hypothetical protein
MICVMGHFLLLSLILSIITTRIMIRTGMLKWESKNAYKILVEKAQRMTKPGRSRSIFEINVKMDLKERGFE